MIYYILFVIVLFLLGWVMIAMNRSAQRVYVALEEFKNKASDLKDKQELLALKILVYKYAIENCYHRHMAAYANQVLAYIDGCLKGLEKKD